MDIMTDKIQQLYRQIDDKLSAIESTIGALSDSKKGVPPEVLELERSIAEKERRLSDLESVLRDSEYARGAWAVMGQGFSGLVGCVASLLQCSDENRAAVDRALGISLFGLVFKSSEEAKKAVQWVRSENRGRILCVLVDQIPSEFEYGPGKGGSDVKALTDLVSCSEEMMRIRNFLLGTKYQVNGDIFEYGLIDGGSVDESAAGGWAPERMFAEAVRLRESINLEGSRLRQLLMRMDPSRKNHPRYDETESLIKILQHERIQLQETLQSLKMVAELPAPVLRVPESAPEPSFPPERAQEFHPEVDAERGATPAPVSNPDSTAIAASAPPTFSAPAPAPVSLPDLPEAPALSEITPPPRPKYDAEKLSKFKILVIEDDEECAELTRTVLERVGLKVEWSDGGPSAVSRLETESFDLIVLDLMLPVQSGWQVYRSIKSNSKTKNIPIVVLSAITPSPGTFDLDIIFQKPLDESFVKKIVSILIPSPPRLSYPSR